MSRRVLLAAAGACAVATLAVAALPQVPAHARQAARDAAVVGCDGQGPQSAGNMTTRQRPASPAVDPVFQGGVLVASGGGNNDSSGSGGRTGESLQSLQAAKQPTPTESITFSYEKLERTRAPKRGGEIESYSRGSANGGQSGGCPPAQRATSRRTK